MIALYNRRSTVERAIVSARSQTVAPARIIVVDDGSTDGSAELAEELGVVVVRQQNAGPGAARNRALQDVRTGWTAFLDSDDIWLPDHLATLLAGAGESDLVGSNARGVPTGRLVGHPHRGPKQLTSADMLFPESPLCTSAIMVRTELARKVGGFGLMRLGEDRDFWCRLLQHGTGVALPEITILYAEHSAQVSSDAEEMRYARRQLIASWATQPWMTPDLAARIDAVTSWDETRSALRSRKWRSAAISGRAVLSKRGGIPAVVTAVRYRAALRDL
ncbi:glycosyltransferase family 2 protein [Motilibacter deserti]|uniref:Glycosyltransferase family 2 protein n=1 Tax=Motilibacter deserti TaxID=2714956 RepID=A0ABX0GUW1_9ACTN|nr:glycosyltransferase family 2 protein [Motilibacter deserti]